MTHRLAGILSDYLSREQMIEKMKLISMNMVWKFLWTVFWKHFS